MCLKCIIRDKWCIFFCGSKIVKNRTLCTILTITTVSPTKHNVLHHNVGMSQSLLCMTELHNFDFIIDIFAEQQLTFVISVISVFLLDCKTHSGVSCSRTFNIVTGQAHIDGREDDEGLFFDRLEEKGAILLWYTQCATMGHLVNKKCYSMHYYYYYHLELAIGRGR